MLQLNLNDEEAVVESLLRHDSARLSTTRTKAVELADYFLVSIVIHTASAIDPGPALHLITALSKQREVSGEETFLSM